MVTRQRLAAAFIGAVLLLTGLPAPATGLAVDPYASYDGQSTCASSVLPGTDFLLRMLVRQHPGTSYVSTLRSCGTSGTSEHKDGRALDWGVDAADPREKAMADAWLEKIFATDRKGNPHALARRMGIMYVIWNDYIYSSYRGFEKKLYTPCEPRRECSKTTRHRDHVHISLSRAGAAAQTTFYRARNVPSVPVLYPRTRQLDPVSTAEVTFDVPGDGRAVTTDFKLVRGETYRIVADGLVRTGPGARVADAACRWRRGDWRASDVLSVNGENPWGTSCRDRHTYQASYTAPRTDFLTLQVTGTRAAASEGTVTFSILREDIPARVVVTPRAVGSSEPRPARRAGLSARGLAKERVEVRAGRARGKLTDRALRPRHRYRVVVTGTATSGDTLFDGNCVRYAGRLRPQHTLDLTTPAADHLSLFIQGVRVNLRVPRSERACDGKAHRYVGSFRPAVRGRARVKIWDPYTYSDNSGSLSVLIRRR